MPISIDGSVITLENAHFIRRIDIAQGPATVFHQIRPDGDWGGATWHTILWNDQAHPYESAVQVGGNLFLAGPLKPAKGFAREGAFVVASHTVETTDIGHRLTLRCRPVRPGMPALQLSLRYEIATDLPLLIRQVVATNVGDAPVVVENLEVEILDNVRYQYAHELHTFSDYYECYGEGVAYPDAYFRGHTGHHFPKPIDVSLAPGESVESFRLFEYAAAPEENARALAHHRIFRRLAPWIQDPPLSQQVNTATSYEALADIAVNAETHGIEMVHLFVSQLFTNCGDYELRPDIFPRGADDARRLVDHFHRHGVKVVPYCSTTIAWQPQQSGSNASRVCREHEDWQYLGPEGIRYSAWGQGNMCYQSDWGDYITAKLDGLTDLLGFDGLHIDGPYHWLPCLETGHRHKTPGSVPYLNWRWEQSFFGRCRERGLYLTAPQDKAAILFGVNARPGGYTEHDFTFHDGLPLVNLGRSIVYDARHYLPACCAWSWVSVDTYHGHSIQASEEDTTSYEHALGACFGVGHWGLIHGNKPYVGPRTQAIFKKWVAFFKAYRRTLAGEVVHLVRPDGKHPDALLHVRPEADPPALLVVFNPSATPGRIALRLPLHLAGFAENGTAQIEGIGAKALDSTAAAVVDVDLGPFEIRTLTVKRA